MESNIGKTEIIAVERLLTIVGGFRVSILADSFRYIWREPVQWATDHLQRDSY